MELITRYLTETAAAIAGLPAADIEKAVDVLFEAWHREGTVYIVGNGGSAATASHVMNDLTKLTRVPGRRPFRALALTDNVPLMTAWANDEEFANIFVRQLETFLGPSDVVAAISTSGNSLNIVRAVEFARDRGAMTLAFAGRHGGRMRAIVDVCVCVPSDDIGQQEDAHLALSHVVSYAIRERVRADPGKADEVLT
ncbi:MAG: SIS domain-containing protein [Vicinamibacterales bacterium]|nr:SIS domain-containing protein [Vicinamibacterales bacterium]